MKSTGAALSHSFPKREYPRDKSVPDLLAAVARRFPDRPAVIDPAGATLDYQTLVARARGFAASLIGQGVRANDIVPLVADRGVDLIVAAAGTLFAGAAYLPIDPSYPDDRIDFMVDDAQGRVVVAGGTARLRAQEGRRIVRLEAAVRAGGAGGAAGDVALPAVDPRAPAYVMYTSGSTGRPKGVVVPHRAIVRLVMGQDYARFDETRRMLQMAPTSFDASTFEVWAPLLHGGCTVIYPGGSIPDPDTLRRTIRELGITTLWLTTSLYNAFIDEMPDALAPLDELLVGGEALSVAHIRRGLRLLPRTQLINGYGPTEGTTFTTCYRIPRELPADLAQIPIGPALANTELLVVTDDGAVAPRGTEGELLIGGDGLALRYLARDELTRERFVAHPIDPAGGERVYRTGDRVRMREDGVIEFGGRRDDQIKLNGFRIELAEIESVLREHPGVRDAVVAVREDVPGRRRLVGYVVAHESADGRSALDVAGVLEVARARLAAYMVPEALVVLDKIPVTPTGKADRKNLPRPADSAPRAPAAAGGSAGAPPVGQLEADIARIWADLLGQSAVSMDGNFFDLGGSSLLAVRTLARLRQELALDVSLVDLYAYPTVRTLARAIAAKRHGGASAAAAAVAGATSSSTAHASAWAGDASSGGDAAAAGGPIAVIGMALRFPGVDTPEAYWDALVAGRDTISWFKPEELDASVPAAMRGDPDYVPARGIVDGFDQFDPAFFGIPRREAEVMDPQQRLFLEVTHEALERAGYDSERYAGKVGVYGGSGNTTYWHYLLSRRPDVVDATGDFVVRLANEKDFLTSRVSYRLGLRGPALAINTACSTSLVTIAAAVVALRRGECDMAVAGGSSINVPVRSGHLYQEGSMLSRDGRCRPFDADASGTVFSDGVGIVVLKRLDHAIRDNDTIHCVIRGVGTNNDGALKMSFSAPSVQGQSDAIGKALQDARVDARDVSYVEAHGTATPVGDPIEVTALTQAYRRFTPDVGFCGIGSSKGNFGHLVSAAGVAGFIKVALGLRRRVLPKTPYFQRANPALELDTSPFHVISETVPWPAGRSGHRIAGVSSFGVGGTNAHAVLEEAPDAPAPSPSRPEQLLLLSARSPEAVTAYGERLAGFLEAQPEVSLADVAFTLAAGRRLCAERIAVVASSAAEAAAALRRAKPRRVEQQQPRVVFVFPGQGSQCHRMGLGLYDREVVFSEALDACRAILAPALGGDLLALLDPPGGAEEADAALRQTRLAQPALFALEYALARQFQSWGVAPSALIGHSVGEFVAACLAGVMSLEDALGVVALRGQLMQSAQPGSMLSVRLSLAALEKLMPEALDLAAVNAPELCVVGGPSEAIDAFAKTLEGQGIACRKLHTSHAFHSRSMADAAAAIEAPLRRIALRPPSLPIYSTVTGRELTAAEATDPLYWARQLRSPVTFAAAVGAANDAGHALFLDLGPRDVTAQLVRQQLAPHRAIAVLGSETGKNEQRAALAALGELWKRGVTVGADALFAYERRSRIVAPTYPYERVRCWVDPLPAGAPARVSENGAPAGATPAFVEPGAPADANGEGELAEIVARQLAIMRAQLDLVASDPEGGGEL
jgi:amino acid adenylation domain-containing protein